MRHPAFLLVGALQTLERCAQMQAAQRLDVRTKLCDVLQQCVTGSTSAYDLQGDGTCLYTQVQDIAASEPGSCSAERELQSELQVLSSMLLTSALTGCLTLPLPGDAHPVESLQQNLRAEIERLTCA
jgi:hypothetical protein